MSNLFDGIDNIDWASLKITGYGDTTAETFPVHLRNMLTEDKEQYEKAFDSIASMTLYDPYYWSGAALSIIPYLLRLLDDDDFHFKVDLLDIFSEWFEGLDGHFEYKGNKTKGYYPRARDIYYKVMEYFDRFIPYLKHENNIARESAFIILFNFREKATEMVSILLNHFTTETDPQVLGTMSFYIPYLVKKAEHQLRETDISQLIEIYRQKELMGKDIEMKCRSATIFATKLPHLIPDEVIHIFEDVINNHPEVFRKNKREIGNAIEALNKVGQTINIDIEIYRQRELVNVKKRQQNKSATWLARYFPRRTPDDIINMIEIAYRLAPIMFNQNELSEAVNSLKAAGRTINIDLEHFDKQPVLSKPNTTTSDAGSNWWQVLRKIFGIE